jgi:nicotinate-nucleotide pyrophosphorylase
MKSKNGFKQLLDQDIGYFDLTEEKSIKNTKQKTKLLMVSKNSRPKSLGHLIEACVKSENDSQHDPF